MRIKTNSWKLWVLIYPRRKSQGGKRPIAPCLLPQTTMFLLVWATNIYIYSSNQSTVNRWNPFQHPSYLNIFSDCIGNIEQVSVVFNIPQNWQRPQPEKSPFFQENISSSISLQRPTARSMLGKSHGYTLSIIMIPNFPWPSLEGIPCRDQTGSLSCLSRFVL